MPTLAPTPTQTSSVPVSPAPLPVFLALTAVTQQTITTVTGFAAPVTLSGLDTTTKFMDHMKSKTAFILEENNSCTPKILFYGQKSSVCTMFSEQELIGGKICYESAIKP